MYIPISVQMKLSGITGNIRFDQNNHRDSVMLDIFQLEYGGLKLVSKKICTIGELGFKQSIDVLQVGNWTKDRDITFMSNYSEAISEQTRKTLGNKTLIVVSALVSSENL